MTLRRLDDLPVAATYNQSSITSDPILHENPPINLPPTPVSLLLSLSHKLLKTPKSHGISQSKMADTTEQKTAKKAPVNQQKPKKKPAPPPVYESSEYDSSEDENDDAQQGGANNELLPVGKVGDTAKGLTNTASNTLGNVASSALGAGQGRGAEEKQDTLRLRLDLNLDIEITLKARIHGDLTLALLLVFPFILSCCSAF